jgi:hypothetical protein
MCVLFAALFQLEPSPFAFRTFPPKENHNVGLLRFDDDHDHICYRFAQVQIFGGKSNVFKSLQYLRAFDTENNDIFCKICMLSGILLKISLNKTVKRFKNTRWNVSQK